MRPWDIKENHYNRSHVTIVTAIQNSIAYAFYDFKICFVPQFFVCGRELDGDKAAVPAQAWEGAAFAVCGVS